MHPHESAKIPSLGSAASIHVNPIDSCRCSNELRAQLNLTNDHKEKKFTIPARMSCYLECHVNGCGQSLEKNGTIVDVAADYAFHQNKR